LSPANEFFLESILKLFRGPAAHDLLKTLDRADVLHPGQFFQSGPDQNSPGITPRLCGSFLSWTAIVHLHVKHSGRAIYVMA
jgi:hypothetical protein